MRRRITMVSSGLCLIATLLVGHAGAECYPQLPRPILVFMRSELVQSGNELVRMYYLQVFNWRAYPDEMFEPSPDLPPCGLNPNASRTWVDIYGYGGVFLNGYCALDSAEFLRELRFSLPPSAPPPPVFVVLWDRRCGIKYQSLSIQTNEPTKVRIPMDIMPGSCTNPFNVKWFDNAGSDNDFENKKGGVTPVALLGFPGFDVRDLRPSSIRLNGIAPVRTGYGDVSTAPVSFSSCACPSDEPDGLEDLKMKFLRRDLADVLGPVEDGDQVTLELTGTTKSGVALQAFDCVTVRSDNSSTPAVETVDLGDGPRLLGVEPNPFNPVTRIRFRVTEEGFVRLSIYDVAGKLVSPLVAEHLPRGTHLVEWEGTHLASGIYFCRLEVGTFHETRKIMLVK